MFMFSFRLSPKRLLAGALALVVVVGVGIFGVRALRGGDEMTSAVPANEAATEEVKVKTKKVSCKTNEDRVAFIRSYGWEVTEEPVEVQEVIIPEEFDAVYQDYNSVQKKQGYDLEDYAGKRCKRYTYVITNHPTAEGEVRCNLLVYRDKLVGGDVCATEQNGFLHGFAPEM